MTVVRIEYGIVATLVQAVPCDGLSRGLHRLIEEDEQVTVGKKAGPDAWWVQHQDGRKGVAFTEELLPV